MAIDDGVRPAEKTGENLLPTDLCTAKELYETASTLALDNLCSAEVLANTLEKLNAKKRRAVSVIENGKAMDRVHVLLRFLRAECIGNWNLHFVSSRYATLLCSFRTLCALHISANNAETARDPP